MKETHASAAWCQILGYQVLDPDGWDRRNFDRSWSEWIDKDEFLERIALSTVRKVAPSDFDDFPAGEIPPGVVPVNVHDALHSVIHRAIEKVGVDIYRDHQAVMTAAKDLRRIERAGVDVDSDVWIDAMQRLRDAVDRMPVSLTPQELRQREEFFTDATGRAV